MERGPRADMLQKLIWSRSCPKIFLHKVLTLIIAAFRRYRDTKYWLQTSLHIYIHTPFSKNDPNVLRRTQNVKIPWNLVFWHTSIKIYTFHIRTRCVGKVKMKIIDGGCWLRDGPASNMSRCISIENNQILRTKSYKHVYAVCPSVRILPNASKLL